MLPFDCIIIGAGVSGMTAAIYLKRANLNILLLESTIPGGQIVRSSLVENYPGFKSIDGPTLSSNIFEQVSSLGVKYENILVKKIEKKDDLFNIETVNNHYLSKSVIIATGRRPKELGLPNEHSLIGKGISWCAYCDGFFYKNKDVAIVGGGNSALEEALYLSGICNKIYIILRGDKFRGVEYLQNKVFSKTNITVIYNREIKELVTKEGLLESIILDNKEEIPVSGVFEYIGSTPNIELLSDLDINLENNYILVDNKMKTNINGIFACGDIINKEIYQLSTAIGEGTIAADSVSKYLHSKDN